MAVIQRLHVFFDSLQVAVLKDLRDLEQLSQQRPGLFTHCEHVRGTRGPGREWLGLSTGRPARAPRGSKGESGEGNEAISNPCPGLTQSGLEHSRLSFTGEQGWDDRFLQQDPGPQQGEACLLRVSSCSCMT